MELACCGSSGSGGLASEYPALDWSQCSLPPIHLECPELGFSVLAARISAQNAISYAANPQNVHCARSGRIGGKAFRNTGSWPWCLTRSLSACYKNLIVRNDQSEFHNSLVISRLFARRFCPFLKIAGTMQHQKPFLYLYR